MGPRASCAGPLQFKRQCCLPTQVPRSLTGPFYAARVPHTVWAPLCEPIRKRCGPIVWCGSTRVHAGPEREGLEGSPVLDVRGNCFIASCMTQGFVWRGSMRVPRRSLAGSRRSVVCLARVHSTGHQRRGATWVLRGSRGSHGVSRVRFTLHGSHAPFGLLKVY